MNVAYWSDRREKVFPFSNHISIESLKKTDSYKKLRQYLEKLWIHWLEDMVNFLDKNEGWSFSQIVDETGIHRDELRLIKQVLNNAACLQVFQIFLERTSYVRENPELIPVPSGIWRWQVEWINFREMSSLLWGKHFGSYIAVELRRKRIQGRIHLALHLSLDVTVQKLILGYVRLLHIGNIPSSRALEFFIQYFTRAWNSIFEDIITEYLNNRESSDVAIPLTFLERTLMEDYGQKHEWTLYASPLYSIIPNTHTPELLFFLKQKKWDTSMQEIREFLRRQRMTSMRSALSQDASRISSGQNMGDFYIDEHETVSAHPHDDAIDIPFFGWCPFAKTKIDGKTNAFLKMYEVFDEWLLLILEGLQEKWLITLKKD